MLANYRSRRVLLRCVALPAALLVMSSLTIARDAPENAVSTAEASAAEEAARVDADRAQIMAVWQSSRVAGSANQQLGDYQKCIAQQRARTNGSITVGDVQAACRGKLSELEGRLPSDIRAIMERDAALPLPTKAMPVDLNASRSAADVVSE